MSDEVKELVDAVKERVRSPLAGTYMFFFVVTNWPLWVFLFSDGPKAVERIALVEPALLCPTVYWTFLKPLLFTCLYLWLMPAFRNWYEDKMSVYDTRAVIRKVVREKDLRDVLLFLDHADAVLGAIRGRAGYWHEQFDVICNAYALAAQEQEPKKKEALIKEAELFKKTLQGEFKELREQFSHWPEQQWAQVQKTSRLKDQFETRVKLYGLPKPSERNYVSSWPA